MDLISQWRNVKDTVDAEIRASTPSGISDAPSLRSQHKSTASAGPRPDTQGSEPPPLGTVSEDTLTRRLRLLRDYANRNGLVWPAQITPAGMERMRNNQELANSTLRRIREALEAQIKAKTSNPSLSEDEEEEEEDDDDDDDDD